jgi:hypothetical protein
MRKSSGPPRARWRIILLHKTYPQQPFIAYEERPPLARNRGPRMRERERERGREREWLGVSERERERKQIERKLNSHFSLSKTFF